MGSVAKSVNTAGIEFGGLIGLQQLLTPTAISALPASLTTSISASATNGMRLVIRVYNHTATGTIAVAGTAPGSAAAVNETTTTLAVAEAANAGEYVDYVTTNIFGAVNASGVTLGSGLTNGTVVIFGIQKASRMLIGEAKILDKQTNVSPFIQHGLYVKDQKNIRTTADPDWEFSGPLFANNMLIWLLCGFSSNLAFATAPASPTVLKTATSVTSGGNYSLTSQPTAPGMILQLVLASAPATAASVSVTGTNLYGETITEVVIATTKAVGTYYSKNAFATVAANGVVYGAFGASTTLAVNGIFCAIGTTSTPAADSVNTLVIENYDSTSSKVACGCLVDELSLEWGMNKEAKIMAKGKAQFVGKVGDLTSSTNQVTAPAQEPEEAITGWESLIFIDNASGTIGTTQQSDVISAKFVTKPNWKTKHTSKFNPPYRVYGQAYLNYREAELTLDLDMTQSTYNTEWVAFSQQRKRLIQLWARATNGYGLDSGTSYHPGFKLNCIGFWIDVPTVDWSSGKESVEIQLKMRLFYDLANAYAWNFTHYTQLAAGWT